MAFRPPRSSHLLLILARQALGMTQKKLGEHVQVSARSVMRWENRRTSMGTAVLADLAPLVYPTDPALAAEMAAAAGGTLAALGIEPSADAGTAALAAGHAQMVVGAVLLAAADAAEVSPKAARAALVAALAKARELGVTAEALERSLTPA